MKNFIFLILIFLLTQGCMEYNIKKSNKCDVLAKTHKSLYICVPVLTLASGKQSTDLKGAAARERETAITMQKDMYTWYLEHQKNNHLSVQLTKIYEANEILKKDYNLFQMPSTIRDSYSKVGADVILRTIITIERRSNQWGSSNVAYELAKPVSFVTIRMDLLDVQTQEQIWTVEHSRQGDSSKEPYTMVSRIMDKVSTHV